MTGGEVDDPPTPEAFRRLVRSAPERWTSLHLVHRGDQGEVEAWLRHGEVDAVWRADGRVQRERGAPPSSWSVRPLEPYVTSYQWSAMLDPWELSAGVELDDLAAGELHGRPVWRARVRAVDGYDPICSCCPLVLGEVSERLEHGAVQPGRPLPEAWQVAVDLATGIVVSDQPVGPGAWSGFENEVLAATRPRRRPPQAGLSPAMSSASMIR